MYTDLVFEVTLAPANQVVKGSDPTKLKYKLTNIQLEYEMIHSENLAEEAKSVYTSGKEFAYDHVSRAKVVPINRGTETRINIKVDAGTRDSEKYIFPDLKKSASRSTARQTCCTTTASKVGTFGQRSAAFS